MKQLPNKEFINIAFGSVPKDGGTYTFYKNLRPQLLTHGINLICVSIGKAQSLLWEEEFADEGCVLLARETYDTKQQAKTFVDWCTEECIDAVIGVNSEAILSAIPHLPQNIRILSRCANAFDHGYRITMSGEERIEAIVALTPRLRDDLIKYYGADPGKVHLFPNGIDPEPFEVAAQTERGSFQKLQLGFLGRLEHNQKGVFHLPSIVNELNKMNVQFEFKIAGKGKHGPRLKRLMKNEIDSGQVSFLGALTPNEVPNFLSSIDVFVFTSHFEGCPNALLEAMMAGCVPVSWLIEGITDFLLEQGHTGYLIQKGDYESFAGIIKDLNTNRGHLNKISRNVSNKARTTYTSEIAARSYAHLIKEVLGKEPNSWDPKSWDFFKPNENFDNSLKKNVTQKLKSLFKRIMLNHV